MSFWDDLESHGRRTAFCDESGASLRYDELLRAGELFDGLPDRSLLVLALDNSLSSMLAYLGALRRGHPSIIVNHGNEEAVTRLIGTFGPNAHWSPANGLMRLKSEQTLSLHPQLAVLLSTSGSTGSTKLVRLSAQAVSANAQSIVQALSITADDCAITTLPPGYCYGLSVINSHLAAGARIILYRGSVIEPLFRELVNTHEVTSFAGVPHTYELLDRGGFLHSLPSSIRTMTQAGGRLPPDRVLKISEQARAQGARLFVMYGQTEATARMACLAPEDLPDHSDCVGRPIPGGHFEIVDPLSGAPVDGRGELVYFGPNIMMGYAKSQSDLARGPELQHLRTGDLGERTNSGLYRITGRVSRFAKLLGLRVDLDDVEELLENHGIRAAATANDQLLVVGVGDPEKVARANELLTRRVAISAVTLLVFPLPTVPRLESGKINYQKVIDLAEAFRASKAAEVCPSPNTVGNFRSELAEALGRGRVESEDSLISLGADSLAYVQASMLIEDALGDLPVGWHDLTIAEIERLSLARAKGASTKSCSVPTDIALRPIMLGLIVSGHVFRGELSILRGGTQGGALALLIFAGLTFSRFQLERLGSTRPWEVISEYFSRIALPFYAIALIYHIFSPNPVSLSTLFMVNNIWSDFGVVTMVWSWYIDVLFHCIFFTVCVCSAGRIGRFALLRPWRFGIYLLVGSLAIKTSADLLFPSWCSHHPFGTQTWAYAFALGWLAGHADSLFNKLRVVGLTFACVAWHFGIRDTHTIISTCSVAAILFYPRIRLWRRLAHLSTFLAQATLFIYLCQGVALNLVLVRLGIKSVLINVLFAALLGSAAFLAWQAASNFFTPGSHWKWLAVLRARASYLRGAKSA